MTKKSEMNKIESSDRGRLRYR